MQVVGADSFSTDRVPARRRVDAWNDYGSGTLSGLCADPGGQPFNARMTRRTVGELGLVWMYTSASTCRSGAGQVGPWAAPMRDAFLLLVQEHGRGRMRQFGREVVLAPGDMVMVDATHPWLCDCDEAIGLTVLKLPTEHLVRTLPDPQRMAGRHMDARRPATRTAASVVLAVRDLLAAAGNGSAGPDREPDLAALLLHALPLACDPTSRAPPPAATRSLRRAFLAHVERHLRDPELSVSGIAAALGTSPRALQRLFADSDLTPRGHIMERRLAVAAERLNGLRSMADGSIAGIAYDIGFNDLSHFSRSFRKRYGVSPSAYRRRSPETG